MKELVIFIRPPPDTHAKIKFVAFRHVDFFLYKYSPGDQHRAAASGTVILLRKRKQNRERCPFIVFMEGCGGSPWITNDL